MNIKLAWRNLKKNKLYAFINILGLTVGIASCLLIGIYIRHELSYDRFHSNADRIVRATMEYNSSDVTKNIALSGTKAGPQFKRTFPGVKEYVRTFKYPMVISYHNQVFEEKVFYADANFFSVFSFPLLQGDARSALNAPDKIVITQNAAKKYFGNQDALGKVLSVGSKNFTVAAVAATVPSNSQIQFDFVVPFSLYITDNGPEQWWSASNMTYLLIDDKVNIKPLQAKLTDYMVNTVSKKELKMEGKHYLTYNLQPLTAIHLHSGIPYEFEPTGSITYIYILLAVAILILLIGCVNYINLAIAQSAGRGAEIGVRKVMGAGNGELFWQFIVESVFTAVIASIFAMVLAGLVLPLFNQISGKQLEIMVLFNPAVIGGLAALSLVVGFAAGAYPALLLSNAKLVKILKSGFSFTSGQSVRKSLIVFQFVISIFLIISTIVILQQLAYIRNKDVGYNKSNVVVLPVDHKIRPQLEALKKAMVAIPGVQSVAAANDEPINVGWGDGISTNDGKSISVTAIPVDMDFVKTMQLSLTAGSDYTRADLLQMDTTNKYKNYHYSFIMNESAVKALGWTPEQAIGKTISKGNPGVVKGVIKDFNFKTFHDPITPLILFLDNEQLHKLFIRINSNNTPQIITEIGKVWKDRVTHRPFDYHFLDDNYNALYRTEQRTAGVFTTFSALAIILACLGLFAITAFAVVQRTKEIGIRKVLGASIANIILLIAKDFLALVIIATVIASPIAWYISSKWLQDFAYRIDIQWWVFITTGAAALLVAAITVSIQSTKAALANPVKSLKSE